MIGLTFALIYMILLLNKCTKQANGAELCRI